MELKIDGEKTVDTQKKCRLVRKLEVREHSRMRKNIEQDVCGRKSTTHKDVCRRKIIVCKTTEN